MTTDSGDTAVQASIEDVSGCAARADAQVGEVLERVMAQRRSVGTALDYVRGLSPGVKANCWGLAEAAGHESPYRMQALLGCYRWDWKKLRAELPPLALAWLPGDPGDLIGPGIAVDETAQLKDGDATACVAPQHAGCTGHVENCVTTVFSAWVATSGQAWADFDVFMPERWARDWPRRRAARIPGKAERKTKPQLAIAQIGRLLDAGLPARWAAYDEVYGRSGELRRFCQSRGLAYVAVIPRDFRITVPSGAVIKAEDAAGDAVFERRSCGNGAKGPRLADWALIATASPRHLLLIRRLISRPDNLAFYLCWSPEDQPATMTFFITIAGRRWPAEETFKTGKDVLGWDQCQARAWDAVCRHTALAALAQLRGAAIRNALCGDITLPPPPPPPGAGAGEEEVSGADLGIPLGDAPVPARPGQPCPPRIGPVKLTIAETARLTRLARQHAAGLITTARLA
ncbi:MAG: IS701 family transposase, partial [Streptosporangiaceae bacterium]